MSLNTITDAPTGTLLQAWDDSTRTHTDYRSGQAVTRPYSPAENTEADARLAVEAANYNEATLLDKATKALATNATFLALASPTNAQTLAQVKALTRQVNALIRLATKTLDTTEGA